MAQGTLEEDQTVEPDGANEEDVSVGDESLKDVEALWNDRDIFSFSFRRHGNYTRDPSLATRGSLHPEGISEVKEIASQWAGRLPKEAEVSFYESPSYMIAKGHAGTPQERELEASRARQTASIYEARVLGGQKPGRRIQDQRLGDFLESATTSVGPFYDVLKGSSYEGKLSSQFWQDYVNDTLEESVRSAIEAVGGTDSLGLAENLARFIEETHSRFSGEESADAKRVALTISHGETIEAFTHYLSLYLEQTGTATPDTIEAFKTTGVGYNEGIDVHVAPDEVTIVVENKHVAAIKLPDFMKYMADLREQRKRNV